MMTARTDEPLTPEEFESLSEIAKGLLAGEIPPEHKKRLFKLGLIMTVRMEDRLTYEGQRRLAQGRP